MAELEACAEPDPAAGAATPACAFRLARPRATAGVCVMRNPACAFRPESGPSASRGGWYPPESASRGIRRVPSAPDPGRPSFGVEGPPRGASRPPRIG